MEQKSIIDNLDVALITWSNNKIGLCSEHGFDVLRDTFKYRHQQSDVAFPQTKQEYEALANSQDVKTMELEILDTKIFELHKTLTINEFNPCWNQDQVESKQQQRLSFSAND